MLYPSLLFMPSFSIQSSFFCPHALSKSLIPALILYTSIFILPSFSTRTVYKYLLSVLILYPIIFTFSAPYDSVDCYSWSIRAPAPADSTCQGVDLNRNWDVTGELTLAELLPFKLREEILRQKIGIMEGSGRSKLGFRKHMCGLL
jgi:hypothetical protein